MCQPFFFFSFFFNLFANFGLGCIHKGTIDSIEASIKTSVSIHLEPLQNIKKKDPLPNINALFTGELIAIRFKRQFFFSYSGKMVFHFAFGDCMQNEHHICEILLPRLFCPISISQTKHALQKHRTPPNVVFNSDTTLVAPSPTHSRTAFFLGTSKETHGTNRTEST